MFVLSHPHTDHVGRRDERASRASARAHIVDAGFPGAASSYRESLAAAREPARPLGSRASRATTSRSTVCRSRFSRRTRLWTAALTDPNLASVVTLVRVGDVRIADHG